MQSDIKGVRLGGRRAESPAQADYRPSFLRKLGAGAIVLAAYGLVGCANLASVRTLGSGIQTVTADTGSIVAADESSCAQANVELAEYNRIFEQRVSLVDCARREHVLGKLLQENKAFEAYGAALSSLAQDQYVTTDEDGKAVSAALTSLGGSAPLVAAVDSIFTAVEHWALSGYRERHIKDAINGAPAQAFLTVTGDMGALVKQYRDSLDTELQRIDLIETDLGSNDVRKHEPIAAAEMDLRLKGLTVTVKSKQAALDAYAKSVAGLPAALASAQRDVKHPDKKAIAAAIKTFASEAKDAHDKIAKAFP